VCESLLGARHLHRNHLLVDVAHDTQIHVHQQRVLATAHVDEIQQIVEETAPCRQVVGAEEERHNLGKLVEDKWG
jgi:hypothetical protein